MLLLPIYMKGFNSFLICDCHERSCLEQLATRKNYAFLEIYHFFGREDRYPGISQASTSSCLAKLSRKSGNRRLVSLFRLAPLKLSESTLFLSSSVFRKLVQITPHKTTICHFYIWVLCKSDHNESTCCQSLDFKKTTTFEQNQGSCFQSLSYAKLTNY